MPSTPGRAAATAAAAVLLLAAASPTAAQPAPGEQNCDLRLQPTDSTRSVSRRVGEQTYVTYLWNGMTWLCGPATMRADSAVRYETRQRLELLGAVHYRDTIRDLRSRRMTYFQPESRVLAEDSVRLRQLESGAVLRGPRVEFFNMVRGEGRERTVATERPRMTIPPPGDADGEPFRVVADTAVFVGEEAAEAFGDVVVRRGGLTARGGYTRFLMGAGSGYLTRSPSVEGEAFTLTGDTVRVGFQAARLRTVRAVSGGRLRGEDVEVRAPRIVVRLEDDRVDELWALGPGGGRAYSAGQQVRGDSLHFAFAGGRLTRLTAVGNAAALQVLPSDSAPAAPDTTAGGGTPGRAEVSAAADTAPLARTTPAADTSAADSAPAGTERRATDGAQGRAGLGLDRNWIAGDTVFAVFSAADADSAAAPPDSAAPAAGPGPDSAVAADSASSDTARNAIERIVAAGNARSFYRIERDSAPGGLSPATDTAAADTAAADPDTAREGPGSRLARNYVIGDRITIRIRDGSPQSVRADRAIGLFLEPTEMPDSLSADSAAADSAAPPDSLPPDSARPDAAVPETTADTAGAPGDTTASGPPRPAAPNGGRGDAAGSSRSGIRHRLRHTSGGGRYNAYGWHDL